MKKLIGINIGSKENLVPLLTILYGFGRTHFEGLSLEESIKYYQSWYYPSLYLNRDGKFEGSHGDRTYHDYETELNDIVKQLLNPKSVIIENVGDYKAEVFQDGVKVGCQTITHEKVEEIWNAIQSLKH